MMWCGGLYLGSRSSAAIYSLCDCRQGFTSQVLHLKLGAITNASEHLYEDQINENVEFGALNNELEASQVAQW